MKSHFKKFIYSLITLITISFMLAACDHISTNVNVCIYCDNDIVFEIKVKQTNVETVYDLLVELDQTEDNFSFESNEGSYGVYITAFNNISEKTENAKYYYWALYVNDQYSQTGVSSTKIESNMSITFRYESFDM